jgi:uncharacterized Zn-binding protein involved in type VI secretion
MKAKSNRSVCAALLLGSGFIVLNLGFLTRAQAESARSCSNETLQGTYVYSATGYIGTASIPIAISGSEVFHGNGTITSGVMTTAIEGQPISRTTYKGTYTVKPDCTATETDTDNNGNVFHYDEFTGPTGDKFTFIETDPHVVISGYETRLSGEQNSQ